MTADVAVIGRGLWGSAAAMYLAQEGMRTVLIGPSEPADLASFNGPFSSHFDAGRITRSIARDTMWARASARSIERYAALEAESGIRFFTGMGGVMASDEPAYWRDVLTVAKSEGLDHERLEGGRLADRFPMFRFSPGTVAAWDATGGVIDPRAMRFAHETLAMRSGVKVVDQAATVLTESGVRLADGTEIAADHVLVCTGSYAGLSDLLPAKPDLFVAARTVFFAELVEAEAQRLSAMPSLIWRPSGQEHYLYLLPPIRYPDGRWLVKIGGEANDIGVSTEAEARDWFHGPGSADVGAALETALRGLMPDMKIIEGSTGACILAHSPTGFPYIGRLSDRLSLAAACCGAGAKCADELGRVAARVAMGDTGAVNELGADVTPRFG